MSEEKITKAVGYIRVATGSSRKRERSGHLQRKAILDYAKIRNVQIVRFFADLECIEDIALRQGLSDALAFIASGQANGLVVASLDRITPSGESLCNFFETHKFLDGGPILITVKEKLDTRTKLDRVMLGASLLVTRAELNALACEARCAES